MRKKILISILAFFAKQILSAYHPDVVGITGSVGKTSAKEAIALVLASRFRVRASHKNFNTEIGVPLTILGYTEIPKNIFAWLGVFLRGLSLILIHNGVYPSILILEMGADKPGDIGYLTKLAPCKIGVLTAISPVHLEKFGSFERLSEEKRIIYRHLSSDGTAIIPADDPEIFPIQEKLNVSVISFGMHPEASVRADAIHRALKFKEGDEEYGGIECDITVRARTMRAFFPLIFRSEHLSCILAALAVGTAYRIPLQEMLEWLSHYQAPVGRSRLLSGIKHTLIIDDTYNSSPRAVRGAVDALDEFEIAQDARRIAVLGDMRELGAYSRKEHEELGRYCAYKEIDLLVTVGPEAKCIATGARQAGMDSEHVEEFDKSYEAGRYLQEKIKRGDILLIKGSQDIRMEKIVQELMSEPHRAKELLVRQEDYWKKS